MFITIGSNTLEVISAGAKRLPSGKVLVIVEAKQDIISHDDLRTLFKDTTDDLIVNRDNGTKETFGGCHYAVKVADDVKTQIVDGVKVEVEIHRAEIECNSEADFQLGRMRGTIDEQGASLKQQAEELLLQANELLLQAQTIVSQGETIAVQNEQVAKLLEASASQLDAIDFILTEGLPLVAQEAATMALAALEEETPDEEAEYYNGLEQEAYEEMIASETITEEN